MTEKTTLVSKETLADKDKEIVLQLETYQHLYAGANTIMADGRKLVFGGAPGGPGTYATQDKDEIEFLDKIAKMGGSQITKITQDVDGREKVVGDVTDTVNDIQAAQQDAIANTVRDANPAIAAARANISKIAAQNG